MLMRYQPQGLAKVRGDLQPGCRLAFNAASQFDSATGKVTSAAFPVTGWPNGLIAGPFNAAPYPTFSTFPVKQSGSFTIVVYGAFSYCGGKGPILSHYGGTGGWKFSVFNNNFSYTQYGVADYTLTTVAAGYTGVVVAVVTPGVNIKVYKNGVLSETVAIGAMSASSGSGTLVIGNRSGGTDTPLGTSQIASALYIESALSDAQIMALSVNPWSAFTDADEELGPLDVAASSTTVAPSGATLGLIGYAPAINQPQGVAPAGTSLSLTGYAPSVAQSAPQTIAPAGVVLALSGNAPGVTQYAAVPAGDGGGAGSVREVRAFADLLDKARKPTRGQKKKRRAELVEEVRELLPPLPEAEQIAPAIAQIVFEQESKARAMYAERPIEALAPVMVPFDAKAAIAELIERFMSDEAMRRQIEAEQAEEDEIDAFLLLGS